MDLCKIYEIFIYLFSSYILHKKKLLFLSLLINQTISAHDRFTQTFNYLAPLYLL